jgi:deoxyribodipyrimidine photo-lyase
MHNRIRMVVASFLTRRWNIDWRWGEKYFAQKLIDVDPYSNAAGWGWASGTGVDAMGYRPPLNPYRQSKRFDPDAVYIKRWVPELKDIPAKELHKEP